MYTGIVLGWSWRTFFIHVHLLDFLSIENLDGDFVTCEDVLCDFHFTKRANAKRLAKAVVGEEELCCLGGEPWISCLCSSVGCSRAISRYVDGAGHLRIVLSIES